MRHPELLIPAGSPETLKTAVHYGADAVYIGGDVFSLRAKAKNFDREELADAVTYCHARGVKVYVTANILAHNHDLESARAYFEELRAIRPDAILIADPGMFMIAREVCPDIDLHISTQANNTNYATCLFWKKLGASRVVLGRELSLSEIREISERMPDGPETEVFVHGAMCISYSGRCLLSNYFVGRDANRGACTHPCRWEYAVMEMTRPGEYLPVEENERGTFIFNSKDLCMIEHLPDLYDAGIASFKIEGRMKTALYIATTARTYRKAMRDYEEDPALYRKNLSWYHEEIRSCTYRQFTTGFFYGKPDETSQIYDNNTYTQGAVYLGCLEGRNENGDWVLFQKNKFCVGDTIEIMKPSGEDLVAVVRDIKDEEGAHQESAPHPLQKLLVSLELSDQGAPEAGDILRKKQKNQKDQEGLENQE